MITSFTGTSLARLIPAYYGGTGRNRVEQYKALEDGRACSIVREIIVGKASNQVSNIKYYSKSRKKSIEEHEKLYEYATQAKNLMISLDKHELPSSIDECRRVVLTYEAQIADIYWRALAIVCSEYGFRERIKKPDVKKAGEMSQCREV